jgi:ATP diphosphatase
MSETRDAGQPGPMNGARDDNPAAEAPLGRLLRLMATLRDPVAGCPWDVAQSFATIVPYTIEEAYEIADAVARGDLDDLRDELGDLLLQVVFHARIAEERGAFDFGGVVEAITTKLIRRHPHVFGDARDLAPAEVKRLWDEIKQTEKRERAERLGEAEKPGSVLDGVPISMPSLTRADKLTRKAAKVGFEWPDLTGVTAKIEEELAEVREAVAAGDKDEIAGEIGDLLFTVANLARHLDVDPEAALAATNRKFERRFRAVEQALAADGRSPEQSDLAEMDRLWDDAKAAERAG